MRWSRPVFTVFASLLAVSPVSVRAAQVIHEREEPAGIQKGKFLVATRTIEDPAFAGAVILIIRFDAQGAMGLVVNQRTKVPVASLFPEFKLGANASMPVYAGGPVRIGVNALLWSKTKPLSGSPVFGNVYLIGDKPAISKLVGSARTTSLHLYVGLCGWWPATQLMDETRRGLWLITDADPAVVFSDTPETVVPNRK